MNYRNEQLSECEACNKMAELYHHEDTGMALCDPCCIKMAETYLSEDARPRPWLTTSSKRPVEQRETIQQENGRRVVHIWAEARWQGDHPVAAYWGSPKIGYFVSDFRDVDYRNGKNKAVVTKFPTLATARATHGRSPDRRGAVRAAPHHNP